jgi:hypothetical protein
MLATFSKKDWPKVVFKPCIHEFKVISLFVSIPLSDILAEKAFKNAL